MSAILTPGARVRIGSGRYVGRVGTTTQPPGPTWPDAAGLVGVALDSITKSTKPDAARLFAPSQLVALP